MASQSPRTRAHRGDESPEFGVMGDAPGFLAMGQAPEVVTVGYGCASHGFHPVARVTDRLPLYRNRQLIY